jgi:hypothetical protein
MKIKKTKKIKTKTKKIKTKKRNIKKQLTLTLTQKGGTFETRNGDIISEQFLGIKLEINKENSQYVEIRPYSLNTASLQFLCDNKSVDFKNNQVYINNHPNLVVKMSKIATNNDTDSKENKTKLSKPKKLPTKNKFQSVYESPEIKADTFIRGNNLFIPVRISSNNQPAYIVNNIDYALELLAFVNGKQDKFNNLQYPSFNIDFDISPQIKIIGFPDPKHMTPMLSQPEFMKAYFENISEKQKKEYNKWLIGLYNQTTPDENKIKNANTNVNTNTNTELYKLFDEDLDKLKEKYLNTFIPDDVKQQDEIVAQYQRNLNSIIVNEKPMLRPNIKIRYMFFILQKKGATSEYNFMVKNIREIGPEHTDILKKILELIQTEIPKKFNLLQPEDKGIYNNFYSSGEYGDLFHIEVDYLHPLTRLDTFSYLYKKRMTLEELIFASNNVVAGKPFLQQVKLEYQNKSYNINMKHHQLETIPEIENERYNDNDVFYDAEDENDIFYDAKESQSQSQNGGAGEIFDVDLKSQPINIISCNHIASFDFEIYYEKGGEYYYLVLASGIKHLNKFELNQRLRNLFERIINGTKIHSYKDGLINTYLFNYQGKYIYTVKEHKRVDSDSFFKNMNTPVIRHNAIYDYPFIEQIPKPPENTLGKGLEILRANNNQNKREKFIKTDEYIVIKIDNFLAVFKISTEGRTVWIFNLLYNSQRQNQQQNQTQNKRLKNITDLNDSSFIPRLKKILEENNVYDPQKFKLYTHIFSDYNVNSFHLKILPINFYQSPSFKQDISQTTELRLYDINSIINFMNIDSKYYQKFKTSGDMIFYTKYKLQFIKP